MAGELDRAGGRLMSMWIRLAAVGLVGISTGCAAASTSSESSPASTTVPPSATEPVEVQSTTLTSAPSRPPPLFVRSGGERVQPSVRGFCWSSGDEGYCGEGVSAVGPVISTDEPIVIEFPLEGWDWQVAADADCQATSVSAGLVDGSWTIEVSGRVGLHELALRGEGPEGDIDLNFVVETSEASELGAPGGTLEVLALVRDLEPAVTLFGIGDDLVAAELVFPDQAGGELVVPLGVTVDGNCTAVLAPPEGTTSAVAGLGDPPWRYELRVTIDDGRRFHRGGWTSDRAITTPPPEELQLVPIDEPLPDVEPNPLFVEGPLAETTSD